MQGYFSCATADGWVIIHAGRAIYRKPLETLFLLGKGLFWGEVLGNMYLHESNMRAGGCENVVVITYCDEVR
jgi:hypothetical protein